MRTRNFGEMDVVISPDSCIRKATTGGYPVDFSPLGVLNGPELADEPFRTTFSGTFSYIPRSPSAANHVRRSTPDLFTTREQPSTFSRNPSGAVLRAPQWSAFGIPRLRFPDARKDQVRVANWDVASALP